VIINLISHLTEEKFFSKYVGVSIKKLGAWGSVVVKALRY